jgi:ssDNA-binding Zn-finger/Zn-ribbon topoisomerase 1
MKCHACASEVINKNARFYAGQDLVGIVECPECGTSMHIFIEENEFRRPTLDEMRTVIKAGDNENEARQ